MVNIKILNRQIGDIHKPFVIAEMSGNHNNKIERAMDLVKAAHESGADAIKLQTYTPDTMTINHSGGLFDIKDKKSLWYNRNLYDLYKEAHTPWEWHKEIFDYAKSLGIIAFSTPFDESAVDFLENLDVPAYKIASFETNHFPLLKKIAKINKPVFISTGTSTFNEIYKSVKYLKDNGADKIIIFKCTSSYPASSEHSNLNTIPFLKSIFPDNVIGLSDHTKGIGASIASVALGARVIEKHFTLQRSDGGVDSAFSIEPPELRNLVIEVDRAFKALGVVQLDTQKTEIKSRQFRRSVYVIKDVKEGEKFSEKNIKIIRPGDGLNPKNWERLLSLRASKSIKRGTPLDWDLVS